jgi:hypothetical protein
MDLRVDGAFRFSGSGGLYHAVSCVIGITLRLEREAILGRLFV